MPFPSVTYNFSNGSTADADAVDQNFTDIINGISDGTKDISVNSGTFAGNVSISGNTTLGNASSDTITFTGSMASTLPVGTTNSYDIGSSTLGLRAIYFGANSQTVNIKGSASMSATWTFTFPVSAGTSTYVLQTDGAGVTSWVSRSVYSKSAKTTTYSATGNDDVISVDASGGSWTLSLPAAASNTGKILTIVRTDQTLANAVTIDGNASETINGSTTRKLATQYESYTIQCDGSNWIILQHYIPGAWTSFTPTGSWSSNVGYYGDWRRIGDSLTCSFAIQLSGAPTAAGLTVNLPSGLTIDTAKIPNTDVYQNLGTSTLLDSGTANYPLGKIQYSSTTAVAIHYTASLSDSQLITSTAPITFASGDRVYGNFTVPISGWEG